MENTIVIGLGVQNEVEQRLTEFCQENTLIIANTIFQQHEGCLKGKMASKEALQIGEKEAKLKTKEKNKDIPI